ncbi:Wzz/FepE/Etk N-terminal domain-containing protein [Paraglaciecola hydrolytica]|uniref:Polysaccharide chain length determinant N-terminal domain-containing protein n=1 Tax=Paraglaciecola hydrolytica TaxID=1799789 RepID=A0A135ZZ53_9ALTE|nr:Wzz/FepE/Etk N-terminal domain-containing protein [Paraglaciecola hydrolytica]KXI28160.1 hypothetical protein AX660_17425 [Paraglaciecola hydrolytica]
MTKRECEEHKAIPQQDMMLTVPIYASRNNDELITITDIIFALGSNKVLIVLLGCFFMVLSSIAAYMQTPIYKAEIIVIPSKSSQGNSINNISSQLGGLASLAGVNFNNQAVDKTQIALEQIYSKVFLQEFVNKHNILVPLLAAATWNEDIRQLEIDETLYNTNEGIWITNDSHIKTSPDIWDIQNKFKDILKISESKASGLIKVTLEHSSPVLASNWLNYLITDLNQFNQNVDTQSIEKNIIYLKEQLTKTEVVGMQTVFFSLIEEQTKKLMLANIESDYLFEVVDPAIEPNKPANIPKLLIIILGGFTGIMIGVIFTFYKLLKTKLTT